MYVTKGRRNLTLGHDDVLVCSVLPMSLYVTPTSLPNGAQLLQDPVNLNGIPTEYHDIVCIGAGFSGISMACKLKRRYHKMPDMVVLERLGGPSGTWEANQYPGCACDVPSPLYSLSFRQKSDWSGFFPRQPELRAYIHQVMAEYGIEKLFRYYTVGLEARYDADTHLWHVVTATFDPQNPQVATQYTHYVCKLFIQAVGGLSEPNHCDIPGHEDFQGPIFHSACWDHSVDLKNKHVIVVGNGCSATQFVPEVAKEAKHVTQFVRSKHWYGPSPDFEFAKKDWYRWLLTKFPILLWSQRFLIWLVLESHFSMATNTWYGKLMRRMYEKECRAHVQKLAPPKYHDQLIPRSNELIAACRRRVLDNTYLPSLWRENLDLETSELVRIEQNAVVTKDGRRIPADVIVMGNGFSTKAAGSPLKVRGKTMSIQEHHDKFGFGSPVSYRTAYLTDFPNMCTLVGPNSGTGHMSVLFTSERVQEMLLSVGKDVLESPRPHDDAIAHVPGAPMKEVPGPEIPTFEVKAEALVNERNWIDAKMENLVFVQCDSWYRDSKTGRVTGVYPDWQWKFMLRCWFPVWSDFVFTGSTSGATHPASSLWQKIGGCLGLGTIPRVASPAAYVTAFAAEK